MTKHNLSCEEAKILIMGHLDGELDESQASLLDKHIQLCNACLKRWRAFVKLKERTGAMTFKALPDMYWDGYWGNVYNRIERGLGWILTSIGAILLLGYAFYEALQSFFNDPSTPFILKVAVALLGVGLIVLFISVVREKLMVRKVDKYRSVKR